MSSQDSDSTDSSEDEKEREKLAEIVSGVKGNMKPRNLYM